MRLRLCLFQWLSLLTFLGETSLYAQTNGPEKAPVPLPEVSAPPSSMELLDNKRKLGIGDRISFRIVEDKEAPKALFITDSGEVEFPYVGRVAAEGKTSRQLAQELKVLLEKDYYYHATVLIGLDTISKVRGKIYLMGQIRQQGPMDIPIDEVFTLSKAILKAGGFGDFADKKKVKLVRRSGAGEKDQQTIIVDVVEILERGNTAKDPVLQPDDRIIVSQRLINF
jgi:protein involved in polysaccharide export with SLBB domain